jgi:hypothetical protein
VKINNSIPATAAFNTNAVRKVEVDAFFAPDWVLVSDLCR